jgi:hypothetical protein
LPGRILKAGLLASFFVPLLLASQTTLENQDLRVELIGLKKWTVPMIQDSLAKYAPHDSLLSHSCAAVLRDKLKFADASVTIFPKGQLGLIKDFVAVAVIEPQDSDLIKYRPEFKDTLPQRKEWLPAWQVVEHESEAFQLAIQTAGFMEMDRKSMLADKRLRSALPLQAFLKSHSRASDRRLALQTLKSDGNWRNRVVAIAMLRVFPETDATWWALLDALRDPNGRVGATAGQVLNGMSAGPVRQVDWRPATGTLRMLLDGTSLSSYNSVLNTLASTKISPSMARALLGGGGNMVLAKLASSSTSDRISAFRFLRQISGKNWIDTSSNWKTWVDGLQRVSVM